MTTINVPERNRAIKSLLIRTYGVNVSVKAGDGTARHWVHVEFFRVPDALAGIHLHRVLSDIIIDTIKREGIVLSTFTDDIGQGTCLALRMPRGHIT